MLWPTCWLLLLGSPLLPWLSFHHEDFSQSCRQDLCLPEPELVAGLLLHEQWRFAVHLRGDQQHMFGRDAAASLSHVLLAASEAQSRLKCFRQVLCCRR